jgi:hypothetical protein
VKKLKLAEILYYLTSGAGLGVPNRTLPVPTVSIRNKNDVVKKCALCGAAAAQGTIPTPSTIGRRWEQGRNNGWVVVFKILQVSQTAPRGEGNQLMYFNCGCNQRGCSSAKSKNGNESGRKKSQAI